MKIIRHWAIAALFGSLAAISAAGCQKDDQIASYRVQKPEAVARILKEHDPSGSDDEVNPEDRMPDLMLAALVPHASEVWFFKLVGAREAIEPHGDAFKDLIRSVQFGAAADAKPEWTLPKGWRQFDAPSTAMRFATLQIEAEEKPLEVTISSLPKQPGEDEVEYLVKNINRWRGQMQLPPVTSAEQLAQCAVPLEGSSSLLVTLAGHFQAGGMRQPPFAQGAAAMPLDHAPIDAAGANIRKTAPAPGKADHSDLGFAAPKGWQRAANDSFSMLAFQIIAGEQKARVTVTEMGPAAGDLKSNVNRWRLQVGLEPASLEEIQNDSKEVAVGPGKGAYVEVTGPEGPQRQTILGVILARDDATWFFKLAGDADLAKREKERFETFVQSWKFTAADGAGDGN